MAAPSITHPFVSAIADGADATVVRPSNWNAAHTLADFSGVSKLLGSGSAAATPDEITLGTGLTMTGTTLSASGSSTWDTIGAAAGSATTANGTNNIVYQTAPVADSKIAWRFTESAAASGGTSTSGVPNQVLLKLDTVAASTQSPLSVYSRAAHVFSVSPTTAQILLTNGSNSVPPIAFAANVDVGFYYDGSDLINTFNSVTGLRINATRIYAGLPISVDETSAATPQFRLANNTTTGIWGATTNILGVGIGGVENLRWTAGLTQASKGTADAISYAINARKSRGSVASPTVITTGDDLLTLSGFGYVGATNTYVEAARITYDSTGTIADTTSGVGGIIRFSHAIVGTVGPTQVAMLSNQHLIHSGTAPTITAGGGTNPTIAGTDESFAVTIGTGGVATSVEVTFGHAFTTNAPAVCVESDTDIVPFKVQPTTTKVTITATLAFTAGSILYCSSRGWE